MNDISIDKYLGMTFDLRHFNCFDLVRDLWCELKGVDLGKQTPYELDVEALSIRADEIKMRLHELKEPRDPCIVLMQRGRIAPHVGVFYKGRVLHINIRGAEYGELHHVTACWPKVSYYTTDLL